MTPLNDALAALRQEQAHLKRLLARVNTAIDALTDAPAKKTKKKVARNKKVATKKRKPMSAAAKKAVSVRMKQYWAGRKK